MNPLRIIAALAGVLGLVGSALAAGSPPAPWPVLCSAAESTERRPVWQGQEGWLFERADLITRLHLTEPLHRYLERLSGALRASGVLPVVLVVPTRASVAYAQLGAHEVFTSYDLEAAALGYRDFLSRLRRAGFLAPDLLAAAHNEGDSFFFKRDHHWSAVGAKASADAVASLLVPHLLARHLEEPTAEPAEKAFITLQRPDREQIGTLQARAEAFCEGLSWPPESVAQFDTLQLDTVQRGSADTAAALFGEVAVPVALAGTSNSLRGEDRPELNFSGFLREALGREVLNASFPGSGPLGALQAYLVSPEYEAAPARVLLWETLYRGWHRSGGLINQLRQIIPSVSGGCTAPPLTQRLESLPAGETVLATALTPLDLRGPEAYVQLHLGDQALTNFVLELRYRGVSERVRLSRSTRAPSTGRYFLELSSVYRAPLEEIILHAPRDLKGALTLTLCGPGWLKPNPEFGAESGHTSRTGSQGDLSQTAVRRTDCAKQAARTVCSRATATRWRERCR